MRFFAAFLAMLGVASAIESYKSVQCGRKNQYIVNTVNRFCAKTNMVAPSTYTRNGLLSLNTYVWLGINGKLTPTSTPFSCYLPRRPNLTDILFSFQVTVTLPNGSLRPSASLNSSTCVSAAMISVPTTADTVETIVKFGRSALQRVSSKFSSF